MADDYEIGYGRPPKRSQFQKGRSGNPDGRPKGTKNLKTDLLEELGEQMLIKEGERPLRVSKQRAMIKVLVARTLKGDTRAANTLLGLFYRVVNPGEDGLDHDRELSGEEQEVIAAFEARVQRRLKAQTEAVPPKEEAGTEGTE